MPTTYMLIWSSVMIAAFGIWRLRDTRRVVIVVGVTLFVLLIANVLFAHLAQSAGIDPSTAMSRPEFFLAAGPMGWLALLVMPTGWLGPVLGLHLAQRGAGQRSFAA